MFNKLITLTVFSTFAYASPPVIDGYTVIAEQCTTSIGAHPLSTPSYSQAGDTTWVSEAGSRTFEQAKALCDSTFACQGLRHRSSHNLYYFLYDKRYYDEWAAAIAPTYQTSAGYYGLGYFIAHPSFPTATSVDWCALKNVQIDPPYNPNAYILGGSNYICTAQTGTFLVLEAEVSGEDMKIVDYMCNEDCQQHADCIASVPKRAGNPGYCQLFFPYGAAEPSSFQSGWTYTKISDATAENVDATTLTSVPSTDQTPICHAKAPPTPAPTLSPTRRPTTSPTSSIHAQPDITVSKMTFNPPADTLGTYATDLSTKVTDIKAAVTSTFTNVDSKLTLTTTDHGVLQTDALVREPYLTNLQNAIKVTRCGTSLQTCSVNILSNSEARRLRAEPASSVAAWASPPGTGSFNSTSSFNETTEANYTELHGNRLLREEPASSRELLPATVEFEVVYTLTEEQVATLESEGTVLDATFLDALAATVVAELGPDASLVGVDTSTPLSGQSSTITIEVELTSEDATHIESTLTDIKANEANLQSAVETELALSADALGAPVVDLCPPERTCNYKGTCNPTTGECENCSDGYTGIDCEIKPFGTTCECGKMTVDRYMQYQTFGTFADAVAGKCLDSTGASYDSMTKGTSTLEECEQSCRSITQCFAFSYNSGSTECQLHFDDGEGTGLTPPTDFVLDDTQAGTGDIDVGQTNGGDTTYDCFVQE